MFDQGGNMNAVRYDDWKVAQFEGAIVTGTPLGRSSSVVDPLKFLMEMLYPR